MNFVIASLAALVFMFVSLVVIFRVLGSTWREARDEAFGAVLGMVIGLFVVVGMMVIFYSLI